MTGASFFNYGKGEAIRWAGHVDPNGAIDPGLIYNADTEDYYISFLCAMGYSSADKIALFTKDGSVTDCSKNESSVGGHLGEVQTGRGQGTAAPTM